MNVKLSKNICLIMVLVLVLALLPALTAPAKAADLPLFPITLDGDELSWSPYPGATRYYIRVASTGGSFIDVIALREETHINLRELMGAYPSGTYFTNVTALQVNTEIAKSKTSETWVFDNTFDHCTAVTVTIREPVIGDALPTKATVKLNDGGYKEVSVSWAKSDAPGTTPYVHQSSGVFLPGGDYKLLINIRLDDNTYIWHSGPYYATINGKDAVFSNNGPQYITASYLFPALTPSGDPPVIKNHPVSKTAKDGEEVSFSVSATGSGLKYQWQYADYWANDPTYRYWYNCTSILSGFYGYNTNALTLTANSDQRRFYRCIVSNTGGVVYSNEAELTVPAPQTISTLKATITPPYSGSTLDYYPVFPSGAHYHCEDVEGDWFENGVVWQVKESGKWKELYPGDIFESGKSYRIFIYIDADYGYRFTDDFTCTLNGITPGEYYTTLSNRFVRILHEFPAVAAGPSITSQPAAKTVAAGKSASFTVNASGSGLAYQWQISKDGGKKWANVSTSYPSAKTATLTFTASTGLNGYMYRCNVTGASGTTTSSAAKLTVVGIKTQPTNQTVAVGAQATFKVVATGAASYQWQYSDNGTTWKNCTSSGYNTDTFSFKASTALNGRQYRCQIKNGSVTVNSNAAKLTVTTVSKPMITTQPTNQSVTAGSKATFKVVASGATSYQWQWSANGTTWTDCKSTGYNTNTFAFTASASLNGRQYRCIVTNSAGSTTSNAAKLTVTSAVTKPTITTQPTDKTVTSGTSVTFKVVASGTGLTYQWQWSGDNGKTWKNCTSTGYNTASFSFKASAALNGRMYRCVVKNSAGSATSTGAKLTVSNVKPTITVQPANKSVTAGTKVSFSVIAAGSGLKYQWQWSADGTTWTNCKSTGYNTATFTFTASASLNNRQYRCVVTNSYGSATSTAGKLTVK